MEYLVDKNTSFIVLHECMKLLGKTISLFIDIRVVIALISCVRMRIVHEIFCSIVGGKVSRYRVCKRSLKESVCVSGEIE